MTTVLRHESVRDWKSMAIPGSEAGSNRLKMDSCHFRHCRGYYHFEVRLWFWTVNRQRLYIEWPARTTPCAFDFSMLFKSANFIYNSCRACETCGIVHFYRHINLGLDVLTWINVVTCQLSLYHVKYNWIISLYHKYDCKLVSLQYNQTLFAKIRHVSAIMVGPFGGGMAPCPLNPPLDVTAKHALHICY